MASRVSLMPRAWGCGILGLWNLQDDGAVSQALSQTKVLRVT